MSTTTAAVVSHLRSPLRSLYQTLNPIFPATFSLSCPFSSRRKVPVGTAEPGVSSGDLGDQPPKLFVVQPRLRPDHLLQAKLSEALNLANSLEVQRDERHEVENDKKELPPFIVVQNPLARSRGRAGTYFGSGTVENVKCQLNAMDTEDGPDAIFVNTVLSGVQQRNLERAWEKPVLDRIGLIIEIFNAHAQTKEAKLQSELAALMYKRTRLVRVRGPGGRLTFGISGEAEVVSAKGKGAGGRGFLSGAGESEIQLQRRRIQERREYLRKEIEEVRRTRALQRYARKRGGGFEGQGLATVAIVGYTNAGKSTLVSALSHNNLYRDDRLFATVDPRLRSVVLPSGMKVLLSDTVGFISDLPVQLIEAFHATLEEVVDADLLVHVIDSCAKNLDEQCLTVLEVLKQIGVSEEKIQNMIEVWNKIDLLDSGSGDIINSEENFDMCNDKEGCNSDQGETLLNGKSTEAIYEFSEDKRESIQFVEEDESEDIESNNPDYSFRYGSFSEVFTKDSDAVEHDEVTDEDGSKMASQISTSNQKVQLCGGGEMSKSAICPLKLARVKTSAVTGVGLQELLYIIDEKLSAQKQLNPHRIDHFGRKWRPSYSTQEGNTTG